MLELCRDKELFDDMGTVDDLSTVSIAALPPDIQIWIG